MWAQPSYEYLITSLRYTQYSVLYCTVLYWCILPIPDKDGKLFFPTSNNIFKSQRLKIRQLSFELSDLLAFIRIWGINNINKQTHACPLLVLSNCFPRIIDWQLLWRSGDGGVQGHPWDSQSITNFATRDGVRAWDISELLHYTAEITLPVLWLKEQTMGEMLCDAKPRELSLKRRNDKDRQRGPLWSPLRTSFLPW